MVVVVVVVVVVVIIATAVATCLNSLHFSTPPTLG